MCNDECRLRAWTWPLVMSSSFVMSGHCHNQWQLDSDVRMSSVSSSSDCFTLSFCFKVTKWAASRGGSHGQNPSEGTWHSLALKNLQIFLNILERKSWKCYGKFVGEELVGWLMEKWMNLKRATRPGGGVPCLERCCHVSRDKLVFVFTVVLYCTVLYCTVLYCVYCCPVNCSVNIGPGTGHG